MGHVMCCKHSRHITQHILCALLVTIKSKGPSVRRERVFAHHQPLLLHPPVLKPYFHLLVAQVQPVGQLLPFLSVDEFIHQKFILKFSKLRLRIGLSLLSGFHLCRAPGGTWGEQRRTHSKQDSLRSQISLRALSNLISTTHFFGDVHIKKIIK